LKKLLTPLPAFRRRLCISKQLMEELDDTNKNLLHNLSKEFPIVEDKLQGK